MYHSISHEYFNHSFMSHSSSKEQLFFMLSERFMGTILFSIVYLCKYAAHMHFTMTYMEIKDISDVLHMLPPFRLPAEFFLAGFRVKHDPETFPGVKTVKKIYCLKQL